MSGILRTLAKKLLPKPIIHRLKTIKSRYFSNVRKHIKGKNNIIVTACNVSLKNVTFTIRGNDCNFILHANVVFIEGGSVASCGHNTCFEIKENTYVGQAHFTVLEDNSKIIIGKDCILSGNIEIRTGGSHLIFDKITGERINFAKDVTINDHVWISANCKILKGVTIPKDVIVGFSSVVTKSFEESNVIIAGVPARIVKRGIGWSNEHCPPFNIISGDFEYEK
jgi:acetyltransferase-like isoleucine patch superfamily enzyme